MNQPGEHGQALQFTARSFPLYVTPVAVLLLGLGGTVIARDAMRSDIVVWVWGVIALLTIVRLALLRAEFRADVIVVHNFFGTVRVPVERISTVEAGTFFLPSYDSESSGRLVAVLDSGRRIPISATHGAAVGFDPRPTTATVRKYERLRAYFEFHRIPFELQPMDLVSYPN